MTMMPHPILDVLADRDQPSPLESLVSEDARRALVDAIEAHSRTPAVGSHSVLF